MEDIEGNSASKRARHEGTVDALTGETGHSRVCALLAHKACVGCANAPVQADGSPSDVLHFQGHAEIRSVDEITRKRSVTHQYIFANFDASGNYFRFNSQLVISTEILHSFRDLTIEKGLSAESACDHFNRTLSNSIYGQDYVQNYKPEVMLRATEKFEGSSLHMVTNFKYATPDYHLSCHGRLLFVQHSCGIARSCANFGATRSAGSAGRDPDLASLITGMGTKFLRRQTFGKFAMIVSSACAFLPP